VRSARAAVTVPLPRDATAELWRDVRRWSSFVEGFARVLELSPDWPAEGAKVVWESIPGGRGRVSEKVAEAPQGSFATRVFEDALQGTQTVVFTGAPDGERTRVDLELEYELARYGPLRAVADLLFIRRALRDALRRTLRRFAVEAQEEAELR
jgi:uncharacterized membrane protein